MGITGLLPLLKSIHTPVHVSQYAGESVAVDAYGWLHRGAFSCALELGTGKHTTRYVDYCMHRVRLLRHHNVNPVVVFDGGNLPAKAHVEVRRRERRERSRENGLALLREGNRKAACECFQQSIDISPEMAFQFIKALRSEKVDYVVAPYEADAQLAYLERTGRVAAVITDDSDLLVFGCKRVIFKLDQYGNGVEISRERFGSVSGVNLMGWTDAEFRQMCILSGCDYLPSIQGMGLKTANKYLRKYKTVERLIKFLRMEGVMKVPNDYECNFERAEQTFLYQRVFDRGLGRLVTLTDVIGSGAELDFATMDFIGLDLAPDIAKGIASGDLDPITKQAIVDLSATHGYNHDCKENRQTTKPSKRNGKTMSADDTSRQHKSLLSYFGSQRTVEAVTGNEKKCVEKVVVSEIIDVVSASSEVESHILPTPPKRRAFALIADANTIERRTENLFQPSKKIGVISTSGINKSNGGNIGSDIASQRVNTVKSCYFSTISYEEVTTIVDNEVQTDDDPGADEQTESRMKRLASGWRKAFGREEQTVTMYNSVESRPSDGRKPAQRIPFFSTPVSTSKHKATRSPQKGINSASSSKLASRPSGLYKSKHHKISTDKENEQLCDLPAATTPNLELLWKFRCPEKT